MKKLNTDTNTKKSYNPYNSFVVRASAGSGKTFQLSRRFLFLVAAGADPSKILTITFTNKAAAEMQERILTSALKLKNDAKYAAELDEEISIFYSEELARKSGNTQYRVPRKFIEVSEIILHSAQRLTISTIDSLFWSWVQRFPFEAHLLDLDHLPQKKFNLVLGVELNERNEESWNRFIVEIFRNPDDVLAASMQKMIEEFGLEKIERIVRTLTRFESFIWQKEQFASAFWRHKNIELKQHEYVTEELLLSSIKSNLENVFAQTSKQTEFLSGLSAGLLGLRQTGFLTQQWRVSGRYIKQAKRIQLIEDIERIESSFRNYIDQKAIEKLDVEGSLYFALYRAWQQSKSKMKSQKNELEFNDLTQAAFRIFCSEQGLGAKYSILSNIEHILLDEFQDTSRLQWKVFKSLLDELLASSELVSNRTGINSSLFIVGDTKQSIYGFREADPEILNEVASSFENYKVQILNLDTSYRSAKPIIEHINGFYEKFPIDGFQVHKSTPSLEEVAGGVFLFDLFAVDEKLNLDAREKEAKTIANLICQILKVPERFPVFDKNLLDYRAAELGDFCLLYRDSTHAASYQRELEKLGISSQRQEERGFFKRGEIIDFMQLLQWLALPHDLCALSTVLRSPILQMSDKELFAFLNKLIEANELNILDKVKQANPSPSLALLLEFQLKVHASTPSQTIFEMIKQLHIFSSYRNELGCDEGELAIENILQFMELCRKLEQNGSNDIFSLNKQMTKLAKEDSVGGVQSSSSVVTLMTMHKAKGTEYPFVFLVDLNQRRPLRDRYWLRLQNDDLEDSIYYVGTKDEWPLEDAKFNFRVAQLKEQIQAEEDRLAYVAMTRARQYLFLSGIEVKVASLKGEDENNPNEQVENGLTLYERNQSLFANATNSSMEIICDEYVHACKVANEICVDKNIEFGQKISAELLPQVSIQNEKPRELQNSHYIPVQIYIKNPHEGDGKVQKEKLGALTVVDVSIPAHVYAREIGLFVHEGLESWVTGRNFNSKLSWKRYQVKASDESGLGYSSAYEEGLRQLKAIKADSDLQNVLATYPVKIPEAAICGLNSNTLNSGKIDLFLRDPGRECLVLDYKSIRLNNDQKNNKDLLKLAIEEDYTSQLNAYAGILKEIYPNEFIKKAIYFTSIQHLLIL